MEIVSGNLFCDECGKEAKALLCVGKHPHPYDGSPQEAHLCLDCINAGLEQLQQAMQAPSDTLPVLGTESFGLSALTYNTLRRYRIQTSDALQQLSSDEVRQMRNMGKKSFSELCNVMRRQGIAFRDGLPNVRGFDTSP